MRYEMSEEKDVQHLADVGHLKCKQKNRQMIFDI